MAVPGALPGLGFAGISYVRLGMRLELEVAGVFDEKRLGQVHEIAEKLLSNPVIEDFTVHVEEGRVNGAGA
jgi:phosphoribosylformylglycinamidine synthase